MPQSAHGRPRSRRQSAHPRASGRTGYRAAHRRTRTYHLPTAVGGVAVAAAAAGALTVSGPTAARPLAAGADLASSNPAATAPLSAPQAAALAEIRDQQRAERGTQRTQIATAGQAAAAAIRAAQDNALDDVAADRLDRFAPEQLVSPVTGYLLTSMFGPRWGSIHTGMDMAVPTGTPIRALASGDIVFAGWDGPFGQKIVVRLTDGTEVWYCHQSRFAVTEGHVAAGQLIGYVGSTGHTTGPHLHLEIHPGGGDAVDPKPWLAARGLNV